MPPKDFTFGADLPILRVHLFSNDDSSENEVEKRFPRGIESPLRREMT